MNKDPQYKIVHTPIGYVAQKKLWWWPLWYRLGFQEGDFTNYYTTEIGANNLIEFDKNQTEISRHPEIRRQRRIDNTKLLIPIIGLYLLVKFLTKH